MIILAYPKSGSTWLGYLLKASLEVEYLHQWNKKDIKEIELNGLAIGEPWPQKHDRVCYVVRTHRDRPEEVKYNRDGLSIYMYRDGRDVITSYFFWFHYHRPQRWPIHLRIWHDFRMRWVWDTERLFEQVIRRCAPAWKQHILNWQPLGLPTVSYEGLQHDTLGSLGRLLDEMGLRVDDDKIKAAVDQHTFSAHTQGRRRGEEQRSSFQRKGIVGDWRNHFTEKHRVLFNDYAGDMLIRLGYELDSDWVQA